MQGNGYAVQKSIWNSQQKHIKELRKRSNINCGKNNYLSCILNLQNFHITSAKLPHYIYRHYYCVERELSRQKEIGTTHTHKVMVKSLLSDLHSSHIPQEVLCSAAVYLGKGKLLAALELSWQRHLLMDAACLQTNIKQCRRHCEFKRYRKKICLPLGKIMWLWFWVIETPDLALQCISGDASLAWQREGCGGNAKALMGV